MVGAARRPFVRFRGRNKYEAKKELKQVIQTNANLPRLDGPALLINTVPKAYRAGGVYRSVQHSPGEGERGAGAAASLCIDKQEPDWRAQLRKEGWVETEDGELWPPDVPVYRPKKDPRKEDAIEEDALEGTEENQDPPPRQGRRS